MNACRFRSAGSNRCHSAMRLLQRSEGGQVSLTDDLVGDDPIPSYAILSHTWGPDHDEVTFQDIVRNTGEDKAGYEKIRFCGEEARRNGLRYFWIDTCCIDKSNNMELQEANNSMFHTGTETQLNALSFSRTFYLKSTGRPLSLYGKQLSEEADGTPAGGHFRSSSRQQALTSLQQMGPTLATSQRSSTLSPILPVSRCRSCAVVPWLTAPSRHG
jgi:hypothetical protein